MLSDNDIERLRQYGISKDEALRQWNLLCEGGWTPILVRPCTVGDGIARLAPEEFASLAELHDAAAPAGRWIKFVPASGAATRMCTLAPSDAEHVGRHLARFAFYEELCQFASRQAKDIEALIAGGCYGEVLELLFGPQGLRYAQLPKVLWKFHRTATGNRTPLEEHLREAAACLADADGRSRVHFTVSEEHRDAVREALAPILQRLREELGVALDVGVSVQKPNTHTLALDRDGNLGRDELGRLLLRPGGHGALLPNLSDLHGDLVFVKNVDNICHARFREATTQWTKILGGCLIRVQQAAFAHRRLLAQRADAAACEAAGRFLRAEFRQQIDGSGPAGDLAARRRAVRRLLDRPIRVCGMVRNEGEPGGGPYWVRASDGSETLQIVERAEVDATNHEQLVTFAKATHFNPVFMALGTRDFAGHPFDLAEFANTEAVIRAAKVEQGQPVTILERPGLWNGGMAHWNTVFVEVPKAVFSPVKTVMDLLRPEHQPQ